MILTQTCTETTYNIVTILSPVHVFLFNIVHCVYRICTNIGCQFKWWVFLGKPCFHKPFFQKCKANAISNIICWAADVKLHVFIII